MTAELVKTWLIPGLISGNLCIPTVLVLEKLLLYCFWVPRQINLRFFSKTQWQMFLLVSGRHVGAHPDGHQPSVSIQISINLGKKLLRISCIRNIAPRGFGAPYRGFPLSERLQIAWKPPNYAGYCLAIIKDPFRNLKTPFNYFLLSMPATDLTVGAILDPVEVVYHIDEAPELNVVDIKILHIFYFTLSTESTLTLAALAMEIYFAVASPVKYKSDIKRWWHQNVRSWHLCQFGSERWTSLSFTLNSVLSCIPSFSLTPPYSPHFWFSYLFI